MITRVLLYIKHNLRFIWSIIEWINDRIFSILYGSELEKVQPEAFKKFTLPPYSSRQLRIDDTDALFRFIQDQDKSDLKYFNAHRFDLISIKKQFKRRSFLPMGIFDGEKLAGYFFLRFFANRKCFVGRFIDKKFRGRGIGNLMNDIMYETAWAMGFRCMSTISKNNTSVMKAHSKNHRMIILRNLKNDYMLVEFVREDNIGMKNIKAKT
jgi:RimJ/RimL family protein N-acetyltransferase